MWEKDYDKTMAQFYVIQHKFSSLIDRYYGNMVAMATVYCFRFSRSFLKVWYILMKLSFVISESLKTEQKSITTDSLPKTY